MAEGILLLQPQAGGISDKLARRTNLADESSQSRMVYSFSINENRNNKWHLVIFLDKCLPPEILVQVTLHVKTSSKTNIKLFISFRQFFHFKNHHAWAVFIPADVTGVTLEFIGVVRSFEIAPKLVTISTLAAFCLFAARRPSALYKTVTQERGPVLAKLRQYLFLEAQESAPLKTYQAWIGQYDRWTETTDIADQKCVLLLLFNRGDAPQTTLQATLWSLRESTVALRVVTINGEAAEAAEIVEDALTRAAEDYVAVLQAGEIIKPHAVSAMRRFAVRNRLHAVYADEDHLRQDGLRHTPMFKPQPNQMMLLSGMLTSGVHLFRKEALQGLGAVTGWAETLRLAAWLRLDALYGQNAGARLPFIFTHQREDMQRPDAESLARVCRLHLGPAWVGEIEHTGLPLRIKPGRPEMAPKISLIVASTARLPHIQQCLQAVLTKTNYPDFEVVIVVSQETPLDETQTRTLEPLLADHRTRLVMAPMAEFNYSRANNIAIRQTTTDIICLLNDDVEPLEPDWLEIMAGHLQDTRVAAVGAKLYYPNGTVQHGGVIMGLGAFCAHTNRFLAKGDVGYGYRAIVSHELSAVTGACMLLRRDVYDAVGGLDEAFASAYNDVDLCMKIRAAGHAIIWCAPAELLHYETVSFGHHYNGDRAELEMVEQAAVKGRWREVCEDDPYYNPNLSLELTSEWELAFPPRVGKIAQDLGLKFTCTGEC